jgi:hypothetical protein
LRQILSETPEASAILETQDAPMMREEITIAELIRNGTMSAEVAATLWAAVDEQVSFLTVAIPRFAGKTTTSNAIMALRPPDVPVHYVTGEPAEMERLRQEKLGGYLVVAEFSQAPVPGYIWGPPVRRVFDTLDAGYSLQAALHAPSPVEAIRVVTAGNGVSDEKASAIGLVVYIEVFGSSFQDLTRRIAEVYEVDHVANGRPVGRTLFRWTADSDAFASIERPQNFASNRDDLARRAQVLGDLAREGRTRSADVQAAVAAHRSIS